MVLLLTVVASAQDYMPAFRKYTKAVSDGNSAEICAALPRTEYSVINHVSDNAVPGVPYDEEDAYSPLIYDFYRAGILTGSDGGYFNSDSNIVRSEVAAILTRMFDASARRSITLE